MKKEFNFEKHLDANAVLKTRKQRQYRNVLKHLYYNKNSSITNIVEAQGISKPLASSLIDDLMRFGVVLDNGIGHSIGGRRPSVFCLNSDSQYVLGLEIKLHKLSFVLFNLDNKIICKSIFNINLTDDEEYLNQMLDKANDFLSENAIPLDKLLAIGLSIPGLVDSKEGKSFTRLSIAENGIVSFLETKFPCTVIVENDARIMAMGEKEFGKAKNKNNVLCLNLSNGIGLGMIINGVLTTGKNGFAGEFGHILVDTEGALCSCGKIGCLETVFSGKLLVKQIKEDVANGQMSLIAANSIENINIANVVEAILAGDQFSIGKLSDMLEYLGRALVTLIHLLNPEMIIIGGSLAPLGKYILDPIKISVNKYSMTRISDETEILVSDLLDDSLPMGIMANVMCKILN